MTTVGNKHASTRKKRLLLTSVEGAFWPAMLAGYMLVILLQEKGFSNTDIGIVLSVNSIISILIQPLWGMLSDYIRSIKKVFLLCLTCITVLLSSIYFIKSPIVIIALIFLDITFRCGLVYLLDNWVMSKVKEDRALDYGVIRVAGSITYSLVSYLFGMVISRFSAASILPINFLLGLCIISLILLTPDKTYEPFAEKAKRPRASPALAFKSLFGNRQYLAVIFLVTANSFATSSLMNFLPNFFVNVGGSASQSAYANGIKAMAEIPFFIFSGVLLTRVFPKRILTFAVLLNLCALAGIYVASSPMQIMASYIFIGFSYSLMLTAKLRYIMDIVPQDVAATAFTLVGAFESGFASAVSNLFGGYMLDHFPVKSLILIAIFTILAGVAIYIFMDKSHNKLRKKDLSGA